MMTDGAWLGQSDAHVQWLDQRHALQSSALSAWQHLQAAAREAGFDCQLASSFRRFDRQLALWNAKWQGDKPLYNAKGQLLDPHQCSDDDKLEAMLTWSALPGASRHHWGSDIDVYDANGFLAGGQLQLIPAEYQAGGPCYGLACWLQQHAAQWHFGFPFASYKGGVAEEPWHLSHLPSAAPFLHRRHPDALKQALAQADIAGKTVILARFDELYRRYVCNEGVV